MEENVRKIHLNQVDSTNTWAKENYKSFDLTEFTRITADEQLKGRGRFKREWISPHGLNIYLTYFFTVKKEAMSLNNLAQILSLSVAKLLETVGLQPQIKWPNDLLVNGKKIAGILCETLDLGNQFGVILGTGINVNMPKDLLDTIDQPATSLLVETGKTHSKDDLIKTLEALFLKDIHLFRQEGFTPFYKNYDALL